MKKLTVVNPLNEVRSIAGEPEFAPHEEREYDESTARRLTDGSGLVLKETEEKLAPKKKTANPA